MRRSLQRQRHLEYRPSGYHWRRRSPRGPQGKIFSSKSFFLFPLRTHLLSDAKELGRKLTLLSDVAFAALSEKTMPIGPETMTTLLTELCRFQIEAADLAREIAPQRSLEAAAYDEACALASLSVLRQAVTLRDRSAAREPLREVATRFGIELDEADLDYQRVAMRALHAMIEAGEENIRRDRGDFGGKPIYIEAACAPRHPTIQISGIPHQVTSASQPPVFPPIPTPHGTETTAHAPSVSGTTITNPTAQENSAQLGVNAATVETGTIAPNNTTALVSNEKESSPGDMTILEVDLSRNCAAPLNTYRVAKENRDGITTEPGVPR